ncbi:MAG: hypothetical protein A2157_00900 [Deltaproteobacteria bacterium RBG_16_47_11]|nr:MAG: hypothetical protein A2157_00900 [Deltaproteobacteria bacterium RBG_16_47_11]
MMKTKIVLWKFVAIILGIVFGLFVGLLPIGTILRIVLSYIFHWGDSGPDWFYWFMILIVVFAIGGSCYIFLNWANSYLRRKEFSKVN